MNIRFRRAQLSPSSHSRSSICLVVFVVLFVVMNIARCRSSQILPYRAFPKSQVGQAWPKKSIRSEKLWANQTRNIIFNTNFSNRTDLARVRLSLISYGWARYDLKFHWTYTFWAQPNPKLGWTRPTHRARYFSSPLIVIIRSIIMVYTEKQKKLHGCMSNI